ncbi:hypothetical protein GGTG_06418 [Gaeumannomyces tritici R3-111a-1]|uniref:BZIP domain-containing protein n=1 Tax=Gaeumannomyces tritici (strain R3-111a-1) TaxID=644352 RepID=J3NYR6_GAET3|nr:hypothetical protein GGTG_06418 [Gaeumannomyces tritici R3-111a-1]EJT76499.1 hypothetical protein GGTG_06418 [Gaeumannomyces tritici R3-111a-1]
MNSIKREQEFGSVSMSKGPSNTSPATSQAGTMDPLVDSLIDFGEYDSSNMSYQSPSLSPAATSKASFTRPTPSATTPISLLTTTQPLSGPSHDYDMYKQQTGIVPGALATTLAVNQNNTQITGYSSFNIEEYLGMSNPDFDFNTSPSQQTVDMDMEFDSPADNSFFFGSTVNPSIIGGQDSQGLPSPSPLSSSASGPTRVWPGMHQQQAALAKAQAQQKIQQQIIQQRQQPPPQPAKHQRSKSNQPSDPIVEQKITQLLNSMRAKPSNGDSQSQSPVLHPPRSKKDEEDMDEDERLLASEEGKKLTSKERRQLRNKVSARAFRSRRKEYITQLESEIAGKVTENGDLRAHNRALQDENKRLQDLTRMLLSSPSFSDFLDRLSSNPSQLPQPSQSAPQAEQQRPESRQMPKDVNPYATQQHRQQIGMAMIPEQTMDFSGLALDTDIAGFNFQPQVYAVMETPEIVLPSIEPSVLSGKSSNFIGETFKADDEKISTPLITCPEVFEEEKLDAPATPVTPVLSDPDFENDPAFALYNDSPIITVSSTEPLEVDLDGLADVDIFGGIETEKALARYELVDAADEEAQAAVAIFRLERMTARLDSMMEQLASLSFNS